MAAGDYLNQYAEGWTKGDAQIIVGSLADSYQLDDPNAGMINKQAFTEYLAGMWEIVEGIRGKTSDSLIELTEIVTQEEQGVFTAWG
ncbi:MAG: nuclear transport factor 2 family protein, partial [Chloroflexi bacterium]|nr:nuclear transport factor 2 family protein [Chloroflexota bacterium]